jgi:glycosyltransferase involved in cell wall biosynthesis
MNILHLGKYYPPEPGGMETFLRSLCLEQARRGHTVRAVCHSRPGKGGQASVCDHGVEVEFAQALGGASASAFAPGFMGLARRAAGLLDPGVVCLHLPNLSGMLAVLALRRKFIVHWHAPVRARDLGIAARAFLPAYRLLEARVLGRGARIIVTSRAMLEGCPQLAPHRHKCRVVPLGIDLAGGDHPPVLPGGPGAPLARAEIPASSPPGPQAPMVLSLGRFAPYKGFDRLVRAAGAVPGAHFVMAGDGPLHGAVRNLARDMGLCDRIAFPGRVDDAERDSLYAACQVFCLPSVSPAEAFGLVLLEAMAQARPVVASCPEWSGVSEVVAHRETGLLVPPDDPGGLSSALRVLLEDSSLARGMGLAGQARVRKLFDIRAVASLTEQVYATATLG